MTTTPTPSTDELIKEYLRLEGIILRDENVLQITLFEFEYIKGQLQGRLDVLELISDSPLIKWKGILIRKEIAKIKQAIGDK